MIKYLTYFYIALFSQIQIRRTYFIGKKTKTQLWGPQNKIKSSAVNPKKSIVVSYKNKNKKITFQHRRRLRNETCIEFSASASHLYSS